MSRGGRFNFLNVFQEDEDEDKQAFEETLKLSKKQMIDSDDDEEENTKLSHQEDEDEQFLMQQVFADLNSLTNKHLTTMHDYLGHSIPNFSLLFHENQLPERSTSMIGEIEEMAPKSENLEELIFTVGLGKSILFYYLKVNNETKEMKCSEIIPNNKNKINIENNIKYIQVLMKYNILIIIDENGFIYLIKYQINKLNTEQQLNYELILNNTFDPIQIINDNNSMITSLDCNGILIDKNNLLLSIAIGNDNGLITFVIIEVSPFDDLKPIVKEIKKESFQHLSMLPILGIQFPIKEMVTKEVPLFIYYFTLNCVYYIDMNTNEKQSSLIVRAKDRITCLTVHPFQPNYFICGLANGSVLIKSQQQAVVRKLADQCIKVIIFNESMDGVIVGDEGGNIYYLNLQDLIKSQPKLMDNLDGHDLKSLTNLSKDKLLAINSNGRVNVLV
ncbi:hypothetical protein ABK040_009619 [Willaertia magna]